MKLHGYRTDGALRVLIPGGMTVILRGDVSSPPIDDTQADRLGPWIDPPVTLSGDERQALARRLDRSRVMPVRTFTLDAAPAADAKPKPMTKGDLLAHITQIAEAQAKAKAAKAAEPAPAPAPEAVVAPAEDVPAKDDKKKKDDKKEDDKPAPPPFQPRFGTKKLKLEYEVTDREGEGAIGTEPAPAAKNPENSKADEANTPAHLKPYGQ